MTDHDHLTALINRIRSGDEKAIEELLDLYEVEAKAAIRKVLGSGNRLRRILDPSDILQSILMRLQGEARDVQTPVLDGAAYLGKMARNRVIHHARKLATQKRDQKRVVSGDGQLASVADSAPSPEAALMQKDLVEAVLNALSPGERIVAEGWMGGESWEKIASNSGVKAEAIRKRFTRALAMVERSLVGE